MNDTDFQASLKLSIGQPKSLQWFSEHFAAPSSLELISGPSLTHPLGEPVLPPPPPVMFCQVQRRTDGARGVFFLDQAAQPDQWIFNGKSIAL